MHFPSLVALSATLLGLALAHPGHDVAQELREREAALLGLPRNLAHCAEKLRARGLTADAATRRARVAREARVARGLDADAPFIGRRDAPTVLATSHHSSAKYNAATSESVIFSGVNSCVLQAETTEGPYYVGGEYVRSDVRDGQRGVELILDTQVINMATCAPVTNAYVEIWHCNATGVYGGVVANGNGAASDASNARNAMLRGLQHTDSKGVAQFTTIFPGHYRGRAIHIHVLAHLNAAVTSNGKITGGTNAHVGQLFFDQGLITDVEKVAPYSTNTQTLTTNAADSIFLAEAASSDPVVEYSLLGSTVADGLFGWVAFGINVGTSKNVQQAASLAAGVTVTNAGQQVTGTP